MVGEVQVLGVELMESRDVTLDELLLLIVQLVQVCGDNPLPQKPWVSPVVNSEVGAPRPAPENTRSMTWYN